MDSVLVVAAHPDDEILGCGGTMAKLAEEGHGVSVLILGEGVTSRDTQKKAGRRSQELHDLKQKAQIANAILGAKKVYFGNLPDNRFDSVDRLDVVRIIERIKKEVGPTIIFTHCEKDLNIDHQITYEAVLTATRPMVNEQTKRVLSFEVLSSTEWRYPLSFSPNFFEDIENVLPKKLKALEAYSSEMREFPHPRSIEGVRINALYRGMQAGYRYAEAFIGVRNMDTLKQMVQKTNIDPVNKKNIVLPITPADSMAVFNLSNQKSVRAGSFSTKKISVEEHEKWFKKSLADPKIVMFKVNFENKFAGKATLDLNNNSAEISIAIDENFRRKGLAKQLISYLVKYLQHNHPKIKIIRAYIKNDNPQSIKLFESCGFAKKRQTVVKGHKALEYIYKLILCATITMGDN